MTIVFVDEDIIYKYVPAQVSATATYKEVAHTAGRALLQRRDKRASAKRGGGMRTFLGLRCLLRSEAEGAHLRALREYPPSGGIVGHGEGRPVRRGSLVASDDRYLPEGSEELCQGMYSDGAGLGREGRRTTGR